MRISPRLRAVKSVMRVLALWLAAFWLPLTLHCELTGLLSGCATQSCHEDNCGFDNHSCCGEGTECGTLVCKILKTGNYRLDDATVVVPVGPISIPFIHELFEHRIFSAPLAVLDESTGAPPGCLRSWQFVFRAAPAPRAPSARC